MMDKEFCEDRASWFWFKFPGASGNLLVSESNQLYQLHMHQYINQQIDRLQN